jgi:predicted anti-sigma-YlaC factor YlaD
MRVVHRSVVCDRVRAQVSLALDGELSQLESRMIAAHLARCTDCAMFEADVVRVTRDLRAAPLEPLEHPIVITRPRRVSLARAQVAVAAALAVAVLGAVAQIATRESEPAFASPARFDTSSQLTREVNQIIADARAFSRSGNAMTI